MSQLQLLNKKAIKEINDALNRLPKEFSLARRRTVLKTAFKPFLKRAQNSAPIDSGDLVLSIDTKTFRNNKKYVFAGVVTDKKIKGVGKVDGFYAKFIEYGYTHVAWPEKGKKISKGDYNNSSPKRFKEIEAKPFLRPAWEATKDGVVKTVNKTVNRRIKSFEKRNAKNKN
jgi:HK97 gp10 family phage protein